MPQIILDTSVVIPHLDERDALRQPAAKLWTALEQAGWEVYFAVDSLNAKVSTRGRVPLHAFLNSVVSILQSGAVRTLRVSFLPSWT